AGDDGNHVFAVAADKDQRRACGVIAIRDGAISRAQGLKIEHVDTVGAGDTFCGYFAASLDDGLDFVSALRRAAVAGSLACL
ncbi:PfkB family carbohydrate kinase, partial [Rhizobium johnstonii]|uniref:PfkB family carbohydrate kinase n=1 Tax=Rhizobium johnstonii TaxID=3019933 RepID=UPI003F9BC5CC